MRSKSFAAKTILRMLPVMMAVLMLIAPHCVVAKSQFAKEWHKPIKEMPLYFKSSVPNKPKDVPAGKTAITFAGIDHDDVHLANFTIDGIVKEASKLDGNIYDVMLDSANLELKDYHNIHVGYQGGMHLTYYFDREDKLPIFNIELTHGALSVNDIQYLSFDEKTPKSKRSFSLKLTSDLKSKSQPQFDVSLDSIFLVREYRVDRSNKLEPNEIELLTAKFNHKMPVSEAECLTYQTLHAVVSDIKQLNKVRDCTKIWLIRENPTNRFKGANIKALKPDDINAQTLEPQYIGTTALLIPKFETDRYTVRISGDKVIVSDGEWEATFVDGVLYEAYCMSSPAQYSSGVMTRGDNSRIMGIKGLPNTSSGGQYAVDVMDILPKLADVAFYDMGKVKGFDISAEVYVRPDGMSENIVDGRRIMSVKEAEDTRRYVEIALAEEHQFVGPDCQLEGVRGHVSDMTTITESQGNKAAVLVAFDHDGYYTKGSTYMTDAVPWDRLPRAGEGCVGLKVNKVDAICELERDPEGQLLKYALYAANEDKKNALRDVSQRSDFEWHSMMTRHKTTGSDSYYDEVYNHDKEDNLVSMDIERSVNGIFEREHRQYEYLEFDEHGNWTRRQVKGNVESYKQEGDGEMVLTTSLPYEETQTRILSYYEFDLDAAVEAARTKYPDLDAIFGGD